MLLDRMFSTKLICTLHMYSLRLPLTSCTIAYGFLVRSLCMTNTFQSNNSLEKISCNSSAGTSCVTNVTCL